MTFFDVYIGDLADPDFKWDGGDWNGNSPKSVVGLLPNISREEPFRQVQNLIHTGSLVGKQTDWGCWVGVASREALLQIINNWYGDEPIYLAYERDTESAPDIRELVSQLDVKDYALVALES